MPGPDGKLTPEEKTKAVVWFGQRHKLHCQVCGNNNWVVGDHLVQPITLGPNMNLMLGGIVGYPQVMRVCTICGHTMFFNAVIMGILPASSPEAPG